MYTYVELSPRYNDEIMPRNKSKEPYGDDDIDFGEGDAKKSNSGVGFYVNKSGLPLDSNTWERMWEHISDVHPDGTRIQFSIRHELRLPEVRTALNNLKRVSVDPPQSRSALCPPQTRSFRPSFWDVPPLVLGRSAPTPIGLSISYFATNSSTEPITVDLLLQFMTFRV